VLPAVACQLVGAEAFGEAAERAPGVYLGELGGVAYEDDFGPVVSGVGEDLLS